MPTRKSNKRRLYKYSIGDMDKRITFYDRKILPTDISYEESLVNDVTKWAAVESVNPGHLFSDVNLDGKEISHKFIIRYDTNVNAEKIIKYDENIYKIVYIDDPELRKEFMVLYVHLDGGEDKEANR